MLKAKNQIQNGAVAQLGERFNGIELSKYPNLNTNKIHTVIVYFVLKCSQ